MHDFFLKKRLVLTKKNQPLIMNVCHAQNIGRVILKTVAECIDVIIEHTTDTENDYAEDTDS